MGSLENPIAQARSSLEKNEGRNADSVFLWASYSPPTQYRAFSEGANETRNQSKALGKRPTSRKN